MTLLSIQVLALIVAKPIPKLTRVSSIHKLLANAIAKACRYNLLFTATIGGNSVRRILVINQSISLFASKYTYLNRICQWQVARKTQSSTSWRHIINGTKANVVLGKHTVYNTTYKKHTSKKNARGKVCKKKTKVANCS